MKKIIALLSTALCVQLILAQKPIEQAKAEDYSIDIAENNNLASWRYDWNVVNIGAANTNFDKGHLEMANINSVASNYALYTGHKFNEFRLDMRANMNLLSATDLNDATANDYTSFYVTFFIDYADINDVENPAMAACPWTRNKGWISVCFERLAGVTYVNTLINETFDGNGAARYFINNPTYGNIATVDFVDNSFHWFSIETEAVHGDTAANSGINISIYIDGILQTTIFQSNLYHSRTNNVDEVVPFDSTPGYLGFWGFSGNSSSSDTESTGVKVEIDQLQITSFDDVSDRSTATPYERSPKPVFHLEPVTNFAPAASYEQNELLEIHLADLFTYDGDKPLSYSAKVNGEDAGLINNGMFVWEPTEAGKIIVDFEATDGELVSNNQIRFNIVENAGFTVIHKNAGGCQGSLAASSIVLFLISVSGVCLVLARKKEGNSYE